MTPGSVDKKENSMQAVTKVDNANLDVVLSTKPPTMLNLFWREIRNDYFALVSLFLLMIIFLGIYIGAPILENRVDVMRIDMFRLNLSPADSGTLLGTDNGGREIAPLLVVSARNSLNISVAVTALSFIIGLAAGIVAGFYGGKVDNIIMRVTDTVSMMPFLMVTIAIISVLQNRNPLVFILLLTAFTWMGRTRLVRAAALQQRNLDYVSASKTLGTRNIVIIVREVLPNIVDVVVANFVLTFAANIGIETGLSILGWGMGIETPSLGTLIANATQTINLNHRWWTWAPAIVLVITIMLCINFVGNALQRVADPKQRLV